MVSGSGGAEAGEGPAGNRGCAEASIFLKYQTDTFSLDAEDHWAGWEENGKFAQKKSERNHSKWQAEFSVVKKKGIYQRKCLSAYHENSNISSICCDFAFSFGRPFVDGYGWGCFLSASQPSTMNAQAIFPDLMCIYFSFLPRASWPGVCSQMVFHAGLCWRHIV